MQRLAGRPFIRVALAAFAIAFAGAAAMACSGGDDELILATTTSTQDSGLLDALVPEFEDQYDCNVKTIAVGSGEAIRLGSEGEADVLLVHSPKAEEVFMTAGNGESRDLVMHNDFIIVGPADDPAGIGDAESAAAALALISESEATFLSRGDESGTHTKELGLWTTAEIEPAGSWYQETGQGMGATLTVTTEKQGYTLSDRGTYLAQSDNLDLEILYEGDKALNNIYHVIVVDPEKHSEVNVDCARDFSAFMIAADTQATIGEFGVDEFGEPLFIPDASTEGGTSTPAP
jgi:tungstate transport system substrate-binding protein